MSIQITIHAEDATLIREHILGLAGMMGGLNVSSVFAAMSQPNPVALGTDAEAPKVTKTKVKKEADKPAPTPVEEEAPPQVDPDSEGPEEIDDITLRAAASAKATTKELKIAVKALLDKYGEKNVTGLPQDKRAAFLADLEAL